MNKLPDREMLRRDYLRKKKMAWDSAGIVVNFTFLALLIAVALSITLCWFLIFLARRPANNWNDSALHILAVITLTSALVVCAVAGLVGLAACSSYFRWASDIPYVPSVEEQIETLPANEILLRGSQSLPSSPEELLRPAGGQETAKEELLRATTGGTAE